MHHYFVLIQLTSILRVLQVLNALGPSPHDDVNTDDDHAHLIFGFDVITKCEDQSYELDGMHVV